MEIIDVIDNPIVQGWMQNTYRFNPTGLARLVGDNSNRLGLIFGKANGEERGMNYWFVQRNGLNFIILTGKGGTIFRLRIMNRKVFFEDYKIANGVNNFLEDLLGTLTGN